MPTKKPPFNKIADAVKDIANGRMVIVVDDEDRENEGDLVMAANFVTPDAINFMIKHAKGLVCMSATDDILDHLKLHEMVKKNKDKLRTAFTVSVDAAPKHGVKTGISAGDRAKTIQLLVDPETTKEDLVTPGHVFPLKARKMGVLRRAGHTEASVDLATLAGLKPAGVICEIIKENGEMARVPDLIKFAKKHTLKIITIKDLIHYRITRERFIERVEKVKMPTRYGEFDLILYRSLVSEEKQINRSKFVGCYEGYQVCEGTFGVNRTKLFTFRLRSCTAVGIRAISNSDQALILYLAHVNNFVDPSRLRETLDKFLKRTVQGSAHLHIWRGFNHINGIFGGGTAHIIDEALKDLPIDTIFDHSIVDDKYWVGLTVDSIIEAHWTAKTWD